MSAPLGIIAGLGDLPVRIVLESKRAGRDMFVLRIRGFEEPALATDAAADVGIGEIGKQIKLLKAAGCEDLVFAGEVKRPDFSALKLDARGAREFPALMAAAMKGDDALLRAVAAIFEREGFGVLSAADAAGDLSAPRGVIAGQSPTESACSDLEKAWTVAGAVGQYDIGQGCVVCDGLVLAVEAQEGTDAMLARVALLPREIRGSLSARKGVLVKRAKPVQDRRLDLPTIGAATVKAASEAGLVGIGVEAGGALIVGKNEVSALAEAAGLFIVGLDAEGRV